MVAPSRIPPSLRPCGPSMHVLGAARPNDSGSHACRVGGPPMSGGPTPDARRHDHAVAIRARRRGILRTASSLHLLEATADRGPLVAAWLAMVHVAKLFVRPPRPRQRASVPEVAGLRVQRGPHGHAVEVLLRARLPPDSGWRCPGGRQSRPETSRCQRGVPARYVQQARGYHFAPRRVAWASSPGHEDVSGGARGAALRHGLATWP